MALSGRNICRHEPAVLGNLRKPWSGTTIARRGGMRFGVLSFAIVALLACSDSPGSGGQGGSGGSPTGTPSGAGGTGTGTGGAPGTCDCGADELCDYSYHWCGPPPDLGEDPPSCVAKPTTCDDVYSPVCGCDGAVYANQCEAHSQGVDTGAETCGPEVTPAGLFPCGYRYCDPTASYCLDDEGDTGDRWFSCEALPQGCDPSAPDCSCLELTSQMECSVVDGNGVQGLYVLHILI